MVRINTKGKDETKCVCIVSGIKGGNLEKSYSSQCITSALYLKAQRPLCNKRKLYLDYDGKSLHILQTNMINDRCSS